MQRKGWYLVAYDIADPSRLRRVHYQTKKEGLPVQKSVFLVKGTEPEVEAFFDRLEKIMDPRRDDLRAYPVARPSEVWTSGPNPMALAPTLYLGGGAGRDTRKRPASQSPGWFKRLFRKKI